MSLQRRFGRRVRTPGDQRGAAAIEFALVSVVLIPILMGILQYGLFFHSSLNADQGVRETARMAVVQKSSSGCSTGGWAAISCTAEAMVGGSPGDTYVKVAAPDGWQQGNSLLVCVLVRSGSAFGMLPMPNGGFVRANLRMSIEQATPAPQGAGSAETPPAGQDWSWCS